MSILKAEKRNPKLKVKQLRKTGYVPGVLYGKNLDESLLLQFSQSELTRFFKSNSTGSKVELEIGDGTTKALLKEVTYTPIVNTIQHLSFQTLISGEKITSTAQVVLLNKEKIDATILQSLYEITYRALPADLFDKVEIDLEGKQVGDIIRISDLEIAKNEDIEIKDLPDSLIVSILPRVKAEIEITEEAEPVSV